MIQSWNILLTLWISCALSILNLRFVFIWFSLSSNVELFYFSILNQIIKIVWDTQWKSSQVITINTMQSLIFYYVNVLCAQIWEKLIKMCSTIHILHISFLVICIYWKHSQISITQIADTVSLRKQVSES